MQNNPLPRLSLINRLERFLWLGVLALAVGGAAVASWSEIGPLIVQDTTGASRLILGSGTNRDNITLATGVEVLQAEGNTWGDFTGSAVANTGATLGTSITFTNAEADTNYNVIVTTTGTTATNTAAPFNVNNADKYVGGFFINNPGGHNSDVSGQWRKYRINAQ